MTHRPTSISVETKNQWKSFFPLSGFPTNLHRFLVFWRWTVAVSDVVSAHDLKRFYKRFFRSTFYNFESHDFVPLFTTLNTCFKNRNGIGAGCSHSQSGNFWKLHGFHVPSDFPKKGTLNFKLKLLNNWLYNFIVTGTSIYEWPLIWCINENSWNYWASTNWVFYFYNQGTIC